MAHRVIPAFHLRITEKEVPDSPYSFLDVEWLNAPEEQRALRPTTVRSPLNGSYKDIQATGQALYRCLFQHQIGEHFRAYREKYCAHSDQEDGCLRLVLDFVVDPSQQNLLINLPWELLHDGGGWLSLDPGISITRRFNVRSRENRHDIVQGINPPMRVLFAYADPPDTPSVNIRDSFCVASQAFHSRVELLELKVLAHATKEPLRRCIRQGVDILHLLGHGDRGIQNAGQGLFYLNHSESPTFDQLNATELQAWVHEAAVKPRLVVLTACHTGNPGPFVTLGVATALLDIGVEAVVAMQAILYTDEARDFVQAFYESLVRSHSVDIAVRAGRRALQRYQSATDSGKLIQSRLEDTGTSQPLGRWRPHSFATLEHGTRVRNPVSLPAWSVPTLFLQGEGYVGLELPESPFTWSRDGKAMIYVEEGRFHMDKHPVTRQEYRRFAQDTNRPIPNWRQVDRSTLEAFLGRYLEVTDAVVDSWEPNLPATKVTVEDAKAYAVWAGKHLPTPDEWQQAASSGCSEEDPLYPWGDSFTERVCNTRESRFHELWPVFLSGQRFDSCSPAGVCDVVGNASEWTQDEGGQTYVCGGSFKDWAETCALQARRLINNPCLSGDSIGFRCAASLTEWMSMVSENREDCQDVAQ